MRDLYTYIGQRCPPGSGEPEGEVPEQQCVHCGFRTRNIKGALWCDTSMKRAHAFLPVEKPPSAPAFYGTTEGYFPVRADDLLSRAIEELHYVRRMGRLV